MRLSLSVQGVVDPSIRGVAGKVLWAEDALGDQIDGLEMGCFSCHLGLVAAALDEGSVRRVLKRYRANTLHVAELPTAPIDREAAAGIIAAANRAFRENLIAAASFHLDMQRWFGLFQDEAEPGLTLAFENLDRTARSSNTLAEIRDALRDFPRWGLLLDVAHAHEMEAEGEPSAEAYAAQFHDRIIQVHFSWAGNLYPAELVGTDFSTRHSLVSLAPAEGRSSLALLTRLRPPQVIIEGVIPAGLQGLTLLQREIAAVRAAVPG